MKKEIILRNLKRIVQVKNEIFFTQDLKKLSVKLDEKELNEALISDLDVTVELFDRIGTPEMRSKLLSHFMLHAPSEKLFDLILSHHGFDLTERVSNNIFDKNVPWNDFFNYIAGNVSMLEKVFKLMMDNSWQSTLPFITKNSNLYGAFEICDDCMIAFYFDVKDEAEIDNYNIELISLVNLVNMQLTGKEEYQAFVNKLYDNLYTLIRQISPEGDRSDDLFTYHLKDYLRLVPFDKQRGDAYPVVWCSDYLTLIYQLYSLVVSLERENKNELATLLEGSLQGFNSMSIKDFPLYDFCHVLRYCEEHDKDTGKKVMSIIKHITLQCILADMLIPRNKIFSQYQSYIGSYDEKKLYLESLLNEFSSKIHYFDSKSEEYIPFVEQVILAAYDDARVVPYLSGCEDEYAIFLACVPETFYSEEDETEYEDVKLNNFGDNPVVEWTGRMNTSKISLYFLDKVFKVEEPRTLTNTTVDIFMLLTRRAIKRQKEKAPF
ncbi:MAG: hypothetical protein ACK4NC_01310 [Candidatus Gracilibacteria bacterium]